MKKKIKVDLGKKATEEEWQDLWDGFWLKATPEWFKWLGWVLILAAISYLAEKTGSKFLKYSYWLSLCFLFWYLQGMFYRIEFQGIPFIKSNRIRRLISLTMSGGLALGTAILLTSIMERIKGKL